MALQLKQQRWASHPNTACVSTVTRIRQWTRISENITLLAHVPTMTSLQASRIFGAKCENVTVTKVKGDRLPGMRNI